jgi:Mg-chelatase subunit ChlD
LITAVATVGVVLAGATIALDGVYLAAAGQNAEGAVAPPSACSGYDLTTGDLLSRRAISPTTILVCERSKVILDVVVSCRTAPIHIVISVDNSGSMMGQPLERAKDGAQQFVEALDMANRATVRVGVVSHGDPARGELDLVNDPEQVVGAIRGLRSTSEGKEDNLSDSIVKARRILEDAREGAKSPPLEFIVLYTDGGQTYPPSRAQGPARIAKADGVTVAVVCVESRMSCCPQVAKLASAPEYFVEAKGLQQVPRIFERLGLDFGELTIAALAVTDTLPSGLSLVGGSASPEPVQPRNNLRPSWMRHDSPLLPISYEVAPSDVVTYVVGPADVRFVDSRHRVGLAVVPSGVLTVTGLCVTPSATPKARASSTPTPRPRETATKVTPEPSATIEHTPKPAYVPIALREQCKPEHHRSDIALVLDTSSSMTGQKLADAKEAALLFVEMIDLEPGRSQTAVVRFDREADVVRELTRARALIGAAIRSLQVRSGTHIDKGLRTALGELRSSRHLERNEQVMILLTDGVHTGTPGEQLRAAAEVQDAGVRLYTIGLGPDVDEAALKTMAGDDSRYYHAPDSDDLARIYAEIAQDLMCPGKELWGGR